MSESVAAANLHEPAAVGCVLHRIDDNARIVTMLAVAPRSDAYRTQ